jgi:hypothetical protein
VYPAQLDTKAWGRWSSSEGAWGKANPTNEAAPNDNVIYNNAWSARETPGLSRCGRLGIGHTIRCWCSSMPYLPNVAKFVFKSWDLSLLQWCLCNLNFNFVFGL